MHDEVGWQGGRRVVHDKFVVVEMRTNLKAEHRKGPNETKQC